MKESIKTENALNKRSRNLLIFILCAMFLAGGIACVGFKVGNDKVKTLTAQKTTLSAQLTLLQAKTRKQDNINKGIVSTGDTYKDPQGGLGLVNGKITFTMPQGWERVNASNCSLHNIDATVLCYDTAAIAPIDQSKDSEDPYWNANVSVFEYNNTDGNARQWFEKNYNNGSIASEQDINTNDIAGNSALIYQTAPNEGDVDGFYVVVHGPYAVVLDAQLRYGAVYGTYPGAQPYDYQGTYGPILQQILSSIKFKDAQ